MNDKTRFQDYPEIIPLIFIGDRFYHESKSVMSSIYTEDGFRFDWGFVSIALEEGHKITIRPATTEETRMFEKELKKYRNGIES
jgi:hypothetical protein